MLEEKKELKEEDIEKVSGGGASKSCVVFCNDCNDLTDCYKDANNIIRCTVCHGTNITVGD